jgi:hypothetical protein
MGADIYTYRAYSYTYIHPERCLACFVPYPAELLSAVISHFLQSYAMLADAPAHPSVPPV